jgi:signal transduction histidine kinase/CheY-like chemotaxis protein
MHYTSRQILFEEVGLSEALDKSHEAHESRIISSAQTALILICVVCGFFIVRSLEWELYGRVLTNSIAIVFTLCGIYALRVYGSLRLASMLSVFGLSITAGYAAYSSGGISNPAFFWLLLLPVIGGMIGMRTGAVFGSFCSIVVASILITMEKSFGAPPNLTPAGARAAQDLAHQIGQLISFSVTTFFLYKQVQATEDRIEMTVSALSEEVEARTEAEKNAARASEIKSQFLANMSHEIRTPMNGVLGALSLLDSSSLEDKQKEYVSIARSSSNTLMAVINDILDISKIESGHLDIESTSFSLDGLIRDMVQAMSFRANEKGIRFRCRSNIEHDPVMGDPVRVRQVMDNLVGNAIKFTEQGSVSIQATLKQDETGALRFTFAVEDTGIGIPEDLRSLLFVPFSQVESSTTRRFGGTGLGLSICKQLVSALGGDISVSSTAGEGSTFSFTIPLQKGDALADPLDSLHAELAKKMLPTSSEKSNTVPKVLLVEDNQINAKIAEAMLLPLGVSIDFAANGAEAVSMLVENGSAYQLVFMDCQMPVMDGYTAAAEIRRHSHLAKLPIIAMTANAMKGDREKCLAAGMSDYISKPIDPGVLSQKLEAWL